MSTSLQKDKSPLLWIWIFLLPTVVLYTLYTIFPIISTLWYSVLDWKGFSSKGKFIGLANYKSLFQDKLFWNSLKVTFKFLLYAVPTRFLISFLFSLILTSKMCPGKSVFRTMIFIPVVTTGAIIGTIMNMVFDPGNGPVNLILSKIGLISANVSFLGNAKTALITGAVIWVWKWSGTSLIYWIASLQSIPDELYEAAMIDGADFWIKFRYITVPFLTKYAFVILVLIISDAMKVFDMMLTLTNGGPMYATEAIELFIYRYAFSSSVPRLGYASAAATVFGLIFVAITVIQMAVNKKKDDQI